MANLISVKSLPTLSAAVDQEDTKSNFSSLGSYANFHSQAELVPGHVITSYEKSQDVEKTCSSSDSNFESQNSNRPTIWKHYGGMILTLLASLSFSLCVLFVKILGDYGFDAYGASFWRYAGITVPIIPVLFYIECRNHNSPDNENQIPRKSIFDTVWPVFHNGNWKTCLGLLSRGLIGSTSVILRFYALQYLTIGDTAVITYSTPVLVTVMAHFFLGEKCGVVPIIVAFTTLAGVVIVTKPPLLTGGDSFDTEAIIGTSLAVGSLFCSSLVTVITRKIREVNFALMTFIFGIIGLIQSAVMSQTLGHFSFPTGLYDSLLVAGLSILSFIGQMGIILALKSEQAGPVALVRSCDVIFGFLFQFIFLGVVPDEYSTIGAVIVLGGVLTIAFRKWLRALPEDNSTRQTWSFLLR